LTYNTFVEINVSLQLEFSSIIMDTKIRGFILVCVRSKGILGDYCKGKKLKIEIFVKNKYEMPCTPYQVVELCLKSRGKRNQPM
jgi:hypothetical protein